MFEKESKQGDFLIIWNSYIKFVGSLSNRHCNVDYGYELAVGEFSAVMNTLSKDTVVVILTIV